MKAFLAPVMLLCAILIFSLANCAFMTQQTDRWSAELKTADDCADAGNWSGAAQAIQQSYRDWARHQVYLHIVIRHEEIDGAEVIYRRAAAFAEERETSEFRAEIAELRNQLSLLSEMEHVSIGNIL